MKRPRNPARDRIRAEIKAQRHILVDAAAPEIATQAARMIQFLNSQLKATK